MGFYAYPRENHQFKNQMLLSRGFLSGHGEDGHKLKFSAIADDWLGTQANPMGCM
jgi:hypothetical protein